MGTKNIQGNLNITGNLLVRGDTETVTGIWILNETITNYSSINSSFTMSLTFDSYNPYNTGIPHKYIRFDSNYLTYSGGGPDVQAYDFNTKTWTDESARTIEILEECINESFNSWLKDNGVKKIVQFNVDSNLNTNNKTIVGAINELKSSMTGSNGNSDTMVGTWELNDTLERIPDQEDHPLSFISNSIEYTSIQMTVLGPPLDILQYSNHTTLKYKRAYSFSQETEYGFSPGWQGREKYKIITIFEEPTDSVIIEWIKSNAKRKALNGLPPCNQATEGQFLRIVGGEPDWVTISNAEEVEF